MLLPGWWSFEDGIIYYPTGEINLNACIVKDFKPIFGKTPPALTGPLSNQLVFNHSLGTFILFFSPEDELSDITPIMMFQIELTKPIHLKEFLKQSETEPIYMMEIISDGNDDNDEILYTALFTPNFGVQFDLRTKMVSTLIFVRLEHILKCPCKSCAFIRQQFFSD